MVERDLDVPDFEGAADSDDQRVRAETGAPPHHRGQQDAAVVAEAELLGEAEDPAQPLRARLGRNILFLFGDSANLAFKNYPFFPRME